jgi:hypothetical protein
MVGPAHKQQHPPPHTHSKPQTCAPPAPHATRAHLNCAVTVSLSRKVKVGPAHIHQHPPPTQPRTRAAPAPHATRADLNCVFRVGVSHKAVVGPAHIHTLALPPWACAPPAPHAPRAYLNCVLRVGLSRKAVVGPAHIHQLQHHTALSILVVVKHTWAAPGSCRTATIQHRIDHSILNVSTCTCTASLLLVAVRGTWAGPGNCRTDRADNSSRGCASTYTMSAAALHCAVRTCGSQRHVGHPQRLQDSTAVGVTQQHAHC